ncbi:hypothetical protein [Anatilimnocola aggregata]|uniref:hypothetical protein n=1 Tax=Anatilimnocola aggregata TaxID=2528021 RepID=UPI0011A3B610|nr:hypothetical protein [Anatilimnocola aggregata]
MICTPPVSRSYPLAHRQLAVVVLTAVALLACGSASAHEQTIVAVSNHSLPQVVLSDAENALLADAQDGQLQEIDFIEAALIASGIDQHDERARWLRVRAARYSAIDLPGIARLPATHRAPALLAGLHREILAGKFRPAATLVQTTLACGDFNCVTATVLYYDLCSQLGVPVEIVAQSGHVNCRLLGPSIEEVETTRRDWFTRHASEATAAVVIAKPRDTTRRAILPTQLLGRIYYNRALAALEQKDFATAVNQLQISILLDEHDRDARENLLAGLNNWALALCTAGEHAAAAEKIAMGLKLDATYQPLRTNELHIHQQWVLRLCQQQEYARAIQLLEAGSQRRPDAALFIAGQRTVFETWLRASTAAGDTATAAQVLRQAQRTLGPAAALSLEAKPVMRASPERGRRSVSGEASHSQ